MHWQEELEEEIGGFAYDPRVVGSNNSFIPDVIVGIGIIGISLGTAWTVASSVDTPLSPTEKEDIASKQIQISPPKKTP